MITKIRTLIIGVIIIILSIISIALFPNNSNHEIISNNQSSNIINTNSLTMMYETEAGSGEYQVSSDNAWPQDGYTFNEILSKCENGSKLTWDDENKKVLLQTNTSDKCYVYFDKEPDIIYLADYIINNVYTGVDGDNSLYYHDGQGTYTNADQEAGDNSYRYAGANPNNYVCFGNDTETCPEDNLYRIIGVFDSYVKLIKFDYINNSTFDTNGELGRESTPSGNYKGSSQKIQLYYWNNSTLTNTWSESKLNTVNLNTNYINSLGEDWISLIREYTWQVGGVAYENVYNSPVQKAYNYEVGQNAANTTYQAQIGLIYVSDYGYAASTENWTINMGSLNASTNKDNNWMYMGNTEWTITPLINNMYSVYQCTSSGIIDSQIAGRGTGGAGERYLESGAIRPTFYLNSNVQYVSGDGTQENPYRIA